METPYQRFKDDDLILRDELAVDRTLLANERTLLSYLRGGIALMLAGGTFIHFAETGWFTTLGVFCLPVGFAVVLLGAHRFRRMQRAIKSLRDKRLP
jgi:putative membrane protein